MFYLERLIYSVKEKQYLINSAQGHGILWWVEPGWMPGAHHSPSNWTGKRKYGERFMN